MAKRESPAGRSKRGHSPASQEAGRRNLEKGHEINRGRKKITESGQYEPAKERWAKLLSGTITVKDLDDEELARMQVRGSDGGFTGRKRMVPSGIAQAMRQEAVQRANDMVRTAAPQAMKRLLEIARDPDTKDSDAIKALSIVLERSLGKTPQEVRIEGVSAWDEAVKSAADVLVDRLVPEE